LSRAGGTLAACISFASIVAQQRNDTMISRLSLKMKMAISHKLLAVSNFEHSITCTVCRR
jgi:hypothetical protein